MTLCMAYKDIYDIQLLYMTVEAQSLNGCVGMVIVYVVPVYLITCCESLTVYIHTRTTC